MKYYALIAALVLSFVGSNAAFANEAANDAVQCELNGKVEAKSKKECADLGGKEVQQQ